MLEEKQFGSIHDTTILSPYNTEDVRLITVARRSLAVESDLDRPEEVFNRLQFEPVRSVRQAELSYALTITILFKNRRDFDRIYIDKPELIRDFEDPQALEVSEYCCNARIVPYESSPLSGESLGAILSASGVSIGAYLGFQIDVPGPVLVLVVPTCMILCGAAYGISKGLEEGLRDRVRRMILENRYWDERMPPIEQQGETDEEEPEPAAGLKEPGNTDGPEG